MAIDMRSLTEQLVRHEGLKLTPYFCTANKLTIGVGRNLEANGISKAEAMFMLENDIVKVMNELDDQLPWWKELSTVRQHVLVDMAFNMGTFGLMKFQKTLQAIKEERYADAAAEMLDSKWADQVGNRAVALSRAMESDQPPV
jgi:lysozyme